MGIAISGAGIAGPTFAHYQETQAMNLGPVFRSVAGHSLRDDFELPDYG